MKAFFRKNWLSLLILILIPPAAGGIAFLVSIPSALFGLYAALEKPPLALPSYVFLLVWTALYLLMGISSFLIFRSDSPQKSDALFNYGVQLFVNTLWPVLFFRFASYFSALVWLIFLWILVFHMIQQFTLICRPAGWLQIPYLTWISYSGYLNLMIYILNK